MTSNILRMTELTLILEIIGQCEVNYINVTDKNNNVRFQDLDLYNHWSIIACPTRLASIVVTMSVSTFKTDFILYAYWFDRLE